MLSINNMNVEIASTKQSLSNLTKTHLISFIGIIILRIFFDFSYHYIVSDIFDYYNFRNEPTQFSFVISWVFLLTLSPFVIIIFNGKNISSNIMTMLILTSLIPTTTMIAFSSFYSYTYIFLMYLYWFLLLSMCLLIPSIILFKKYFKSSIPLYLSVFSYCGLVIYVSYVFTGFRFHFGLYDVYDIRTEARGYQINTILGYFITASDNLLPILFVLFLVRKQRLMASFIGFITLLNFGISAVKMVLFLLFFGFMGYLFIKSFSVFRYAVWGIILLAAMCIIEYMVFNTAILTDFSLFRIFFIPAKLHYIYYDFFSVNQLDLFRQSALKYFFDSPYQEGIQFLMGLHDIQNIEARANNGLFSDAYLNFGAVGVLIFPFIVVIILKILDGAVKYFDPKVLFIITTSVCFVILGVPFTQALLNSGILILILLLYLIPRNVRVSD